MLKTLEDTFLSWLKDAKTLMKLDYINKTTVNRAVLDKAHEEAILDYENGIMFFCSQKLWKDFHNIFHQYKKNYQNQIRKPFGMSIVDFNDCIREYGDTLRFS